LFERCVFARVPTSNPFVADLFIFVLSFIICLSFIQCYLESTKVTPNVEVISVPPTSLRA
jgi:hypothetical protein